MSEPLFRMSEITKPDSAVSSEDKKQDALIPGDGISIDENNVISCTCEITLINGGDSNE